MKCYFVLLDNCPLTSITGPMEIFQLANAHLPQKQRVELKLVSLSADPVTCLGGLKLSVHEKINSNQVADLVIVGAIGQPERYSEGFPPELLAWLTTQYARGSKIASICTGAFVLAASGLLDGLPATTHWQFTSLFQQRFPKILLQADAIVTQQEGIYCSGGASAYQDLSIYLIKQFFGIELAHQCAKALLFDGDRYGQSQYASFLPFKQHQDPLIHQAQEWIDQHLKQEFTIGELAEKVHLSERQFKRRFKQATHESPLAYVQALRMEWAKRELLFSTANIDVISRLVGYEDVRFFRQLFKRHTSLSPSEYRQKIALKN